MACVHIDGAIVCSRSGRSALEICGEHTPNTAAPDAAPPLAIDHATDAPAAADPFSSYTYSEAWRHECEVRYVAGMDTREDRRRYLAGIRKHCGARADARIKAIISGLRAIARAR